MWDALNVVLRECVFVQRRETLLEGLRTECVAILNELDRPNSVDNRFLSPILGTPSEERGDTASEEGGAAPAPAAAPRRELLLLASEDAIAQARRRLLVLAGGGAPAYFD